MTPVLVRCVETGGGALTWMLYLQPLPASGETLTIALTWPSADFAEAKVALDLGEIRSEGVARHRSWWWLASSAEVAPSGLGS